MTTDVEYGAAWALGCLVITGVLAVASVVHVIMTYPREAVVLMGGVAGVAMFPYLFGWATIRLAEIWGERQ